MQILVLNSGSSSLKYSLFRADSALHLISQAELPGITTPSTRVFDQIVTALHPHTIHAVAYRVVHPGPHLTAHTRITPAVLTQLEAAHDFAPLHAPAALALIHAGLAHFPTLPHFACFDTVFHQTMPSEATTFPIPQTYRDRGAHRYGFHGLSCESVLHQLTAANIAIPARTVIAHLGSGCSITALRHGLSVDNTMGLTPTGGILMGTRPGDLDPGLVLYLLRQNKNNIDAVEKILNHDSGIHALSNLPNNLKQVRAAALAQDPQAILALQIFTRSITKAIGAFAFLFGGLDALIFTGGIGQHDAQTRAESLTSLESFGITLNPALNQQPVSAPAAIHASNSKTAVFVVPAAEDLIIAMHVQRMVRVAT